MNRPLSPSPIQGLARFVFWIIFPLLVGIILAAVLVPVPHVGVIRFEDVIWSESAASLSVLLDHARTNHDIRAVVLEINSPGGEVTATEELYYRLLELRQVKPLVISIDSMAASGGYYMAAAGDHILAKPASLVGNIGVISLLPSTDEQRFTDEDYVSTGPFKFSGGSRGDFMRQLELIKLGFLEAVSTQRQKLKVDPEALSSGEVFLGVQARQLGLIDELGANSEAVEKAASLAHLGQYEVVNVAAQVYGDEPPEEEERGLYAHLEALLSGDGPGWRQELYFLYIEPEKRRP